MTTFSDVKALDELFDEVGVFQQSNDLNNLFDFIKRFPDTAPFNALLLHIQKPGSRFVASAKDWKLKFNRTIKPGARPLVILWPFAPVHFVFELEDTEGDDDFPEELLKPFKTEGKLSDQIFEKLLKNLPRTAVSYNEVDHGTESAGFIKVADHNLYHYSGQHRIKLRYDLIVNSNHSIEEKFATIAHELGHLFCGHLGTPDEKCWSGRMSVSKNIQEFEAESVAWLVCERAGIKNPSAKYLKNYTEENGQIPSISLETVLKSAGMVEMMMNRNIPIKKELKEA